MEALMFIFFSELVRGFICVVISSPSWNSGEDVRTAVQNPHTSHVLISTGGEVRTCRKGGAGASQVSAKSPSTLIHSRAASQHSPAPLSVSCHGPLLPSAPSAAPACLQHQDCPRPSSLSLPHPRFLGGPPGRGVSVQTPMLCLLSENHVLAASSPHAA